MKKFLTMFLIILLCVSAFSGCDNVLSQNGGFQTTDDTLNTNAECEHNWELISQSELEYKCSNCKETHLCGNAEDLEKAGRLNESTLIYKCRICGSEQLTTDPDSINPDNGINDHVPYDSMLNLEIIDGKFRFQRIATTPCIVYSNSPITDMSNGTMYDDRHDILTAIFRATDGKDAIMDTTECEFLHYIYMFDNEREDVPWHYRFAICSCGAVMITNNNQFLCTIEISDDELRTILDSFDTLVCSRIDLCYHGNKDTSITIEDAAICSELMTLITKADGTQGESSKGYYGVPYTLTIYFEGNEPPLVFCLWSDSQYSTSEQRDAEGYQYFFNDDLSDLYQYLEEKYPDEFWYSNN